MPIFYLSSFLMLTALAIFIFFISRVRNIDFVAYGYLSVYMTFYFLLFPITHVLFNSYIEVDSADWVESMTILNIINSLGLAFSILGVYLAGSKRRASRFLMSRNVDWRRIKNISIFFVMLGMFAYIFAWYKYGGLLLTDDSIDKNKPSPPIYFFMLIESTPMLLSWYLIAKVKLNKKIVGAKNFWILLTFVSICALIFSGLRGSRISMIFQIFSFIMIYSIIIRKVVFFEILLLIVVGWLFNNFYSVYKYTGFESLNNYFSNGEKTEFVQKASDPINIILHDLGRSDIQALVYEKVVNKQYTPLYTPDTYLSGLQLILPKSIRSDSIYSKTELGAAAQFGGVPNTGQTSTRIYGFFAESVLNFGLYSIPFVFFLFGFIYTRSLMLANDFRKDSRVLIYPLIVLLPFFVLFYDFDNVFFILIKGWSIPILIWLISKRDKGFKYA